MVKRQCDRNQRNRQISDIDERHQYSQKTVTGDHISQHGDDAKDEVNGGQPIEPREASCQDLHGENIAPNSKGSIMTDVILRTLATRVARVQIPFTEGR